MFEPGTKILFIRKLFVFFLILNCSKAVSQPKGISNIRQLIDSIHVIVRERQISGLMLGIVTKDSVLFSGGFGYADYKAKRRVNGQTLFRMGSITKSLVAIGIMRLVEKGKININDDLRKIAPEVPFVNRWEASHPVKIVNLLEHTTGFDDFMLNRMYSLGRKDYNTKETMLLQKNSMISRWRPSERQSYSNVNYAILGYIIQKVSGLEYDSFLTHEVLLPLGMTNSNFNLYTKFPDKDVREYGFSDGKINEIPSVSFLIGPAGALWSCSDDMVKLLKFWLKNGKPLISPESITELEVPHSSLGAKEGLKGGYALGNQDYGQFRGHEGSMGVCESKYLYSRHLGVGFVISSNGNGLGSVEKIVTDYLLAGKARKEVQAVPLDKKSISPYLGYYQLETPRFDILGFTDRFMILKAEIINDTLNVNILGKKRRLRQTGNLTFADNGTSLANIIFTTNEDGKRVLIFRGRYCEQVPAAWAIGKPLCFALFFLMTLLSFIPAIVTMFYAIAGKVKHDSLPIMILPLLSTMSLTWALLCFLKVFNESYLLYKLGAVTSLSLGIFLGTTLFAVLSTINLMMLLKKVKNISNRFIRWYMLITALSLFALVIVLFLNGWIGLRTWAM